MNAKELQERLSDYAVTIIAIVNTMPKSKAASHMAGQILRSGTSPALNYAEAQSAESKRDFVHKIKVVLKELRESYVCLGIIKKAKLYKDLKLLNQSIEETNELVSIFVASTKTAERLVK